MQAVELAPLAIAALSLAALAGSAYAASRRRSRLADAAHELRRPLQVLALRLERTPDAELVELAGRALLDLEHGLSRRAGRLRGTPALRLEARTLAEQARRRWRGIVDVELDLPDGVVPLRGDASSLAAALDNLIDNAAEHGAGGQVLLRARRRASAVSFTIENRSAPRPDRARGLGRGIVSRTAIEHGGRLLPLAAQGRKTRAAIELPRDADG